MKIVHFEAIDALMDSFFLSYSTKILILLLFLFDTKIIYKQLFGLNLEESKF